MAWRFAWLLPLSLIACFTDTESDTGGSQGSDESTTGSADGTTSTATSVTTTAMTQATTLTTSGTATTVMPTTASTSGPDDTTGDLPPTDEMCNGRDDDMDGEIDEGDGVCPDCTIRTFDEDGRAIAVCDSLESWSDSLAACEAMEYVPMIIRDNATNNNVANVFEAVFAGQIVSGWIGASDLDEEGVWRWTDGTQFWAGGNVASGGSTVDGEFADWHLDDPNNVGGEHCAVFVFVGADPGWFDISCDQPRPYICQSPPLPED